MSTLRYPVLGLALLLAGCGHGNGQHEHAAVSTAATATPPAHAMTTSGLAPASLLAHSQIPIPRVQWATACSMVSQAGLGCFAAITTLM